MPCRDETALERKLDKLAGQIGAVGLAAGGFSLVAMAGQFTWQHFVVAREAWQWEFASTYLHYLITSVTIVVRPEHAQLSAASPGASLLGTVENVVYLGTDTHFHLRLADGEHFIVRRQNSRGAGDGIVQGGKVGILIGGDAAQVLKD